MPGSTRENNQDVHKFLQSHNIGKILDVGCGQGTYWTLALQSHKSFEIDAVEIWEPYIEQFNLREKYDRVFVDDIRGWSEEDFAGYDLVIFGDVLEHMSHTESVGVWHRAHSAKYGLISVPVIHYPQGAYGGNPYEIHIQEHLTPEHIRETYGPFILDRVYEITGTFVKEFR